MESLFLIMVQLRCKAPYDSFRTRLAGFGAWELLDHVWAICSPRSARELKNELREFLDPGDSILVVQAGLDWASRHAKVSLGELIPPSGGPALMLWKRSRGLP